MTAAVVDAATEMYVTAEVNAPVAPRLCMVAKALPAATFPMLDWIAAAIDPATTPVEPKPATVSATGIAMRVPPTPSATFWLTLNQERRSGGNVNSLVLGACRSSDILVPTTCRINLSCSPLWVALWSTTDRNMRRFAVM